MKILITGVCGYVGSRIAMRLIECMTDIQIYGIDNLSRRGSETNLRPLIHLGVQVCHGDVRLNSDICSLPNDVDWVIDCAANTSVTAGLDVVAKSTSRQLVEHNLIGTANILEYCREKNAGLILLSTSRVYSIPELRRIPLRETPTRFEPDPDSTLIIPGFSDKGISEEFSTTSPISLYGATKFASEVLALDYGEAFGFPVRVNRCGVIGGSGQFGKIDQGILSFWVYSFALGHPLTYIGYNGSGKQLRDCILAEDIADLIISQIQDAAKPVDRVLNIGGGVQGAISLREITDICVSFFQRKVKIGKDEKTRPYDVPYFVSDCTKAYSDWGWKPAHNSEEIVLKLCEWTASNMDLVKGFTE